MVGRAASHRLKLIEHRSRSNAVPSKNIGSRPCCRRVGQFGCSNRARPNTISARLRDHQTRRDDRVTARLLGLARYCHRMRRTTKQDMGLSSRELHNNHYDSSTSTAHPSTLHPAHTSFSAAKASTRTYHHYDRGTIGFGRVVGGYERLRRTQVHARVPSETNPRILRFSTQTRSR